MRPAITRRRAAALGAVLGALVLSACTAAPGAVAPPAATTTWTPTTSGSTVVTGSNTAGAPSSPSSPPGPLEPPVATLAALSGQALGPGVTVADGTEVRWYGPTPGESAIVSTDGYEWFGPDGAMVGCVKQHGCVAVEGDGTVAVVLGTGKPRLVYTAAGAFAGAFSDAGAPVAVRAPTLDDALRDSGVDVTKLVDDGTRRVRFTGGITGDPHLITADGTRASTQIAGDFYGRFGDPDLTIQLRFEPMAHRTDSTVVSAVAVGVPGHHLEFTMDRQLDIDGSVVDPAEEFRQISLPDGPELGYWAGADSRDGVLALVWPDGRSVVAVADPALGMTVVSYLATATGGLFGSPPTGAGDLTGRGGAVGPADTVIRSWSVPAQDSLFDQVVTPISPFPVEPAVVPAQAEPQAEAECRAAGITEAQDVAACTFDVALTGDDDFVAYHADLALPAERVLVSNGFLDRWPALVLGSTSGSLPLPDGRSVEAGLGPGARLVYAISVGRAGPLTLRFAQDCPRDEHPPAASGAAAARLFDAAGDAVSARLPLCGTSTADVVASGTYYLVLAGATTGSRTSVQVRVSAP